MSLGLRLTNGCVVAHGERGSNVKRPFNNIPELEMHELGRGLGNSTTDPDFSHVPSTSFHGQLGFIEFTDTHRLPRHVHIATESFDGPEPSQKQVFVIERILVLNGVALVELNGMIYIIPPGSLVTIAPGVPHTWTGAPAGISLPDGKTSDGSFLMVYEYEVPTGFFPTDQTDTLSDVSQYAEFKGDLETIRFPVLTAEQVVDRATLIWNSELLKAKLETWQYDKGS